MDEKNKFRKTLPTTKLLYHVVNFVCPLVALVPYKITFNL